MDYPNHGAVVYIIDPVPERSNNWRNVTANSYNFLMVQKEFQLLFLEFKKEEKNHKLNSVNGENLFLRLFRKNTKN
jgi:hypothetical protein